MTASIDVLDSRGDVEPAPADVNGLLADVVSAADPGAGDFVAELEELSAGAKIKLEIAALWDIYKQRRVGVRYADGVEEELVATRYPSGQAIEEWYRTFNRYDNRIKDYHAQAALVEIEEANRQVFIQVDERDNVSVTAYDRETGRTQALASDEQAAIVEEFFHRSLIAAQRHAERSPEEAALADEGARAMTLERYPLYATRLAADE